MGNGPHLVRSQPHLGLKHWGGGGSRQVLRGCLPPAYSFYGAWVLCLSPHQELYFCVFTRPALKSILFISLPCYRPYPEWSLVHPGGWDRELWTTQPHRYGKQTSLSAHPPAPD